MCVEKTMIQKFCELFPQTAENIKRRALERRKRFMQQKNTNSKRALDKRKESQEPSLTHTTDAKCEEEALDEFHTDEEPESKTGQKEDMKHYLTKLNSRIDILVEALKEADSMIAKQTDQ